MYYRLANWGLNNTIKLKCGVSARPHFEENKVVDT